MASVPFAFSVHHFISTVGADVGFASIIGLAILVLLYFAQARETAQLREQAYAAAQKVGQLENRIAALSRQVAEPAATAAPAPAAAARVAPAPVLTAVPGPPAGVAAPALSAATRLIPASAAPAAVPAAQPAAARMGAAQQPVAQAAAAPAAAHGAAPASPGPAPATVAGGGGSNGASHDRGPASPAPVAAAMAPPHVQMRPAAPPPAPRRPPAQPRLAEPEELRSRRPFFIVLGLIAAAAIAAALIVLTSNNGNSRATSAARSSNAPGRHTQRVAAVNPANVTVAVLNGTAAAGLAHRVSVDLGGVGYRPGAVATASDQTRSTTIVAYLPGHKRDAQAVATSLKLPASSVQAIDQSAQAVACPPPTACTANVVVTVGTDLANH